MHRSSYRQPDEVIARASTAITSWVLGIGFLSLHATLFFVSLVGLLFWNLYESPGTLWALDVFRRWGALLAFHAIAVGAGWLAWRLLRAEQHAIEQNANAQWTPARNVTPFAGHENGNGWHAPAQPSRMDRAKATAVQADEVARRFAHTTVIWSTRMAHGTRAAMEQARERFASRQADGAVVAKDPTLTWPEPVQHRTDDQEFIARFGGANGQQAPSGTPAVDQSIDPGSGSEHAAAGGAPGYGKEAGWTWVEAAAASWLARRELDEHRPAGANGNAPSPPEPSPPAQRPDDTPAAPA